MNDEPINNLEASIILILEQHQGQNEAIKREELVRQVCDLEEFKISERSIRSTIKHLVERHGVWIGSWAKGYFMIQTDQELLAACKYYHGYALSLLHVEAKLRKMSLPALLGQLSIEFAP